MTEFSQLLTDYVHSKNVHISNMAQYCGLDRSTMYKILRGKRIPSSPAVIEQTARYMQLTPDEQAHLYEAYKIALVGSDNYYRRKDVLKFLNHFDSNPNQLSSSISAVAPLSLDKPLLPLKNKAEITHAIFSVISTESQVSDGHICLLLQPEDSFIMDLMTSMGHKNPGLHIEHIMRFNNNKETTAGKDYNLHCLKNILPLYTSNCSYHSYYYYDHIVPPANPFPPFSSMILTSEYALELSADLEHAILYHQPEMLDFFHEIFTTLIEHTHPLLTQMNDVYAQLNYTQKLCLSQTSLEYDFQMLPCLTPFLTAALLNKYLVHQLPDREMFIHTFSQYIESIRTKHKSVHPVFIFSEAGIARFLTTGRIDEFPDDFYTPIEPSDRIQIIRKWIVCASQYQLRLLRENIGCVTKGLSIYINPHGGYLQFTTPQGNIVYLNIEETSLLSTFLDFFETMDSSLYYPQEEALSRLQTLVDKQEKLIESAEKNQ